MQTGMINVTGVNHSGNSSTDNFFGWERRQTLKGQLVEQVNQIYVVEKDFGRT